MQQSGWQACWGAECHQAGAGGAAADPPLDCSRVRFLGVRIGLACGAAAAFALAALALAPAFVEPRTAVTLAIRRVSRFVIKR